MRRLGEQGGFTIVEVMVATAILLTGVLGTLAMMNTASQRTRTASDRQGATALARDVLEAVRSLNYRDVAPGSTIVAKLQAQGGLAGNGSTADWKITRGGTSYAVGMDVCSLDDPADGRGPRTAGGFCSDVVSAGTTDGSPVDYKRVTTTVSWGGGRVRQAVLVNSRGGAEDSPAVTGFTLTSPSTTPITSTSTTGASFTLTTSVEPDSVVWFVDGVQEGIATGSGTAFGFQWSPLPALDGAYEVEARAFDAAAISGETKSLTLVLNRYAPGTPTGFNAGRNGQVVEAEWTANPERDITGYRVYRRHGTGSAVLACSTTTETSCIDPNPAASSSTLNYWVVALDRSPTDTTREGPASAAINVNLPNSAPNAPTGLTIGRDALDRVVLKWVLPAIPDPDSGDSIAFFRIYRGGTTVGDRYENTGSGSDTTLLDDEPTVSGTKYWVTAVDTHMRESTLVGPVAAP